MEILLSEGDVTTGSLLSQDSMYNGNLLIAHFITSHSQSVSQPAFDNTQFYASCNCYQYENITDTRFRVVQNNSRIHFVDSDALDYNFYMYVGKNYGDILVNVSGSNICSSDGVPMNQLFTWNGH